jgi:hypothetical protein
VLDRVSSINDFGVIIDEKMTFTEHVVVMVAKAFAMLGFIRRLSLEFGDLYTLKSLYTCLWNPSYDVLVDKVERVLCPHRMRIDAPFCILTPLRKGDRTLPRMLN